MYKASNLSFCLIYFDAASDVLKTNFVLFIKVSNPCVMFYVEMIQFHCHYFHCALVFNWIDNNQNNSYIMSIFKKNNLRVIKPKIANLTRNVL